MGATLYQIDNYRLQANWNIVKGLIAHVCFKYHIPKKTQGSCRAAAWSSTWRVGGNFNTDDILSAQSDGTNHAEELLLAQMINVHGSPNFSHMYVDISPCTGHWSGHHCQSLLSNGGTVKIGGAAVVIPEPNGGIVWFALNEDQYEKGDLRIFRDAGTPGEQYTTIAVNFANQKPI